MSSDPREDFIEQVWDRIAAKVATLAPRTDQPLLKSDQLASRLGLSTVTVAKYRKQGMPALNLGRSYRYDLAACVEWIRGRAA